MTSLGDSIGVAAVSRYRFTQHLATGGMAEIYAAEASGVAGVTRQVAVKRVLREHAENEDFRRMFANEARLSVRLQHANIVQTYDVLDVKGELYITMELLEGIPLLDLLRILDGPTPGLTVAQAVYIIDRVLAGLHYAHERLGADGEPLGIVHRDVSPHNVFLTQTGNVKLIDFGVAKVAAQSEQTDAGIVKGKVLYMSPEHCRGKAVDRRSDIFSAGLVLYTLLTNHHPFKRDNAYETMKAVIHDPLPLPSTKQSDLPTGFDDLLVKALHKDPEERFATAQEMRDALVEQIREHGLYITDNEFSRLVQDETPNTDPHATTENLPPDLVLGAVPEVHTGRHPAADAALAETPHATVERLFGVVLLKLHGVFNESFDPESLLPHLKGTLLIDTSGVEAVTSYGIRGLLKLYEHAQADSVTHIRCSVAFLQQVGMVRMLLGGGRIVSFHLPYIDPVTGSTFSVHVEGTAAAKMLRSSEPPPRTCPGFPDRDAQFDEDPAAYLEFADAFQEHPDDNLRAVIDALATENQNRQVEKAVDENGTRIWIRRPVQVSFRWRNLLRGLEGAVTLDMEDTPSWTEEGIEALVDALQGEAEALQSLSVLHAPHPLLLSLRDRGLDNRLTASTCRVHALCDDCGLPRRVAVDVDRLGDVNKSDELDRCPSCGGVLRSTETFTSETETLELTDVPAVPPAPDSTLPWIWIAAASVVIAIGIAVLAFS